MSSYIVTAAPSGNLPAPFHRLTDKHYIAVFAPSLAEAQRIADTAIPGAWAFAYPAEDFTNNRLAEEYPAGIYASISAEATLLWNTERKPR